MEFWEYGLLFFSVIFGGGLGVFLQRQADNSLKLALAFGGAYLLGITFLHLIPEVFTGDNGRLGLWILAGFFIQLFLEQLSSGVEHGHIHVHGEGKNSMAVSVMLGLCLHALIEGIPISGYEHLGHGHEGHNHLLYGIILHKIPAAFALSLLLLLSKFKASTVWICLVVFASMSPLGVWIGQQLFTDPSSIRWITAIVIGSFLHISTTIIFESDSSRHHRIDWRKLVAITLGIALAFLSMHEH